MKSRVAVDTAFPTTKDGILEVLERGGRLNVFAWVADRKIDQDVAVEALTEFDMRRPRSLLSRFRDLFT